MNHEMVCVVNGKVSNKISKEVVDNGLDSGLFQESVGTWMICVMLIFSILFDKQV